MKNVKLILEYDLGEFGEDDEYEPSIFPEDWYEYLYQCDITDLINNIKIKEVLIYDTKVEKGSITS
jgi:hypothetical protein